MEAVRTRTRDVVTRYKGRFKHWDVVNEMLHFNYFENVTKNPDFSASVYRDTKLWDPSVLTFVNDYNVVETYDQYATADLYLRVMSLLFFITSVLNHHNQFCLMSFFPADRSD